MKKIINEIVDLADKANGIEEARKNEYREMESKLTHEQAIQALKDDIAQKADADKRFRSNRQLNDMIRMFNEQSNAINQNQNLPPSARKEALRTLEQTFIYQLDEFKRGL